MNAPPGPRRLGDGGASPAAGPRPAAGDAGDGGLGSGDNDPLPLTPAAAQAQLDAVQPEAYARSRNHVDGAVTGLSPWLVHGVLDVPQVLAHLVHRHGLHAGHALVRELGWREYQRHVWRHLGDDGPLRPLHAGVLPDDAYADALPEDVRRGATGLAAIDRAVAALYADGRLHNHARLWLASYLVHLRKVHWRRGADWLLRHLADGDLASNHLSWQWVAGTGSHQPYLFNAENVRRFAPPAWHVDGTALDTDYDTLRALAAQPRAVLAPEPRAVPPGPWPDGPPAEPPAWTAPPPAAGFGPARADAVSGRDVWVVHPWSLRDPPPGRLPVALVDAAFHARWPWQPRRWQRVARRMAALATVRWCDDPAAIAAALAAARRVEGIADPHLGALGRSLGLSAAPAAWPDPGVRCRSFSAWWKRVGGRAPALRAGVAAPGD